MAENFLNYMAQSDQINVASPAKAYQNALDMKMKNEATRGVQLDNTDKLLTMSREAFKNVRNKSDYEGVYNWMNKFDKENPFPKPETIKDDNEAAKVASIMSMSMDDLIKFKKGEEVEIWDLDNPDAPIAKLTPDQIREYKDRGYWGEKWTTKGSAKWKAYEESTIAKAKAEVEKEYGTKSTPDTDIDDYVKDFVEQYKLDNNGKEPPPKLKNEKRLEFKRVQADEISSTTTAKREAEAATAEKIKYNENKGKILAEIATQADLMDAKGEISPQKAKDISKNRMEGNLAKLASYYNELDSMGAILNTKNSTIENIIAASRSSTAGQAVGRITGSQEQAIRQSISNLKPLIIQDIRQSTNMSARGLDSEKELEFYLQAATDEKKSLQSNIAAIVVLDENYGTGKIAEQLKNSTDESYIKLISDAGQAILKPKKDSKNEYGLSIGEIQDGYKYKGGDPSKQENWEKQ